MRFARRVVKSTPLPVNRNPWRSMRRSIGNQASIISAIPTMKSWLSAKSVTGSPSSFGIIPTV